jgi:hypothetical protein
MKKHVQWNARKIFGWIYTIVIIVVASAAIYFFILDKIQTSNAKKSLLIGETYPAEESPYPAAVTVINFKQNSWSWGDGVNGDITVYLPEGSSNPRITWYINQYQAPCRFGVDFVLNGVGQTRTWNYCVSLRGLTVYPNEIFVK